MLIKFLLSKSLFKHLFILTLIILYAFFINKISGNYGVLPADSFGHFDTSYLINKNIFPIRDYWMNTGFLINYIQALFFYLFGANWQSYVLHASFFNALISISTYLFFVKLNINYKYSFIYTICVATLFYPTAGTPSVYFHSSMFSLIAIYLFIICYLKKSYLLAFLVPIFILIGFLCAQVPSAYIGMLLIFSFLSIGLKEKKLFLFFFLGSFVSLLLLIVSLIYTKIPFTDFFYQHILFPLSIGSSRFLNESNAFNTVSNITFDRFFFDFKFIYIFWIPIFLITFNDILFKKKAEPKKNYINVFYLISVLLFILYQLTTNNQLFVYFLIPISAGILHYNLNFFNIKKKINFFLIFITLFATFKYGNRNIVEKRFNDFQWTDMSSHIDAATISAKLSGLKWVTPVNFGISTDVKKEVHVIKQVLEIVKKDKRNKVMMTNFQFFSIITETEIFYTQPAFFRNATQPEQNSKLYSYYKNYYNNFLRKNNIQILYFLDIEHNYYKKIIKNICSEGKIKIDDYNLYFLKVGECI